MALTTEHFESSAPSRDSYNEISDYFCSTANTAFRAQPKLFGSSRRNALTKVCEYFFWNLQIVSVELYNHYWPWNKNDEEVDYKSREKERKTRNILRSKPQKKAESVFEEVGTYPKNSRRKARQGRV